MNYSAHNKKKICPRCGRTYDDSGLNFCLADGEQLTYLKESVNTERGKRASIMNMYLLRRYILCLRWATVARSLIALIVITWFLTSRIGTNSTSLYFLPTLFIIYLGFEIIGLIFEEKSAKEFGSEWAHVQNLRLTEDPLEDTQEPGFHIADSPSHSETENDDSDTRMIAKEEERFLLESLKAPERPEALELRKRESEE
jgi:hypothetical protein